MHGRSWIEDLDPALGVQTRLLHALLDASSDLDVALWPAGADRPGDDDVTAVLRSLGPVVEVSAHAWEGVPRWWVQYADGGQIDLVVLPAEGRRWRAPGAVVLLDRSGRLAEVGRPSVLRALPEEPRRWLLDAWEALSDVAEHLQRRSVLEAVEQLHRARTRVHQLWATGEGVDHQVFGLTSLLDAPSAALPDGVADTHHPCRGRRRAHLRPGGGRAATTRLTAL